MSRNLEREIDMLRVEVDSLRRAVEASQALYANDGVSAADDYGEFGCVKIFAALASRERLLITRELLKAAQETEFGARSAAELVELCALNTTGQAYHNLNVLKAAGIVEETRSCGGAGMFSVSKKNLGAVRAVLSAAASIMP